MKITTIVALTGMALGMATIPALADEAMTPTAQGNSEQPMTMISIAGHDVPVVSGGLYDRYRSNTPLSVVAEEHPDIDLSWFKTLKKTRVDIGFTSYSPNFYYQNSRVTVVFTADLERLKALMPEEVLQEVQPLQVWPGRGAVALTAYTYSYCDNDSYNEIALSVITNKPGHSSWGPLTLAGQSMAKDFWGYVLKLPVNTELARVRGVVGYNLPKWLTGINRTETAHSVVYEILDSKTGKTDVVLETEKLADISHDEVLAKNSFTNLDHNGQLSSGYAISRQLSHADTTDSAAVKLQLNDGSFSQFIRSLQLGKMMKYEYVPDFQIALYAPQPLTMRMASDE